MICPRCGTAISNGRSRCKSCGADLTVYKKIIYQSNCYYNMGLERAQVRDLSGAVQYLRKSLEMNKCNTEARNLLGLVLFEMGETVAALGEWVVSRHFCPENNQADYYMDKLQGNPTKLDTMNQAIKKYNLALEYAKQGGDDLAILQLKKVVGMNPNFLRARQLLALLYLHTGEKERAKKQLVKALEIDVANTTTLRYLKELEEPQAEEKEEKESDYTAGAARIAPQTRYTEDKPNIMAWVALLIGALIGVLVTFLLIVPTAKNSIRAEYNKKQLDYSSELRIKEAAIASMEKEVELWQNKYEEAAHELAGIVIPEDKTPMYDTFFSLLREYIELLGNEESDVSDMIAFAEKLAQFPQDILENADAVLLLQEMRSDLGEKLAKPAYDMGYEEYQKENYSQAIRYLQVAFDSGYRAERGYYYLAKSYQMMNDYNQAGIYFRALIEDYPDSELVQYAKARLKDMGFDVN